MSREQRGPYVQLLRSLCDSEKINAVSESAECLYVRLLASVDDSGRFPGDPKWILAKLFTARMIAGQVTADAIEKRLGELDQAGLVQRYFVDGKAFIQIVNHFRQNRADVKDKTLYPGPERARIESDPDTDRVRNGSDTDSSRERNEYGPLKQNITRTRTRNGPLKDITVEEMDDTSRAMRRFQYLVNVDKTGKWKFTDSDHSRREFLGMIESAKDKATADGGDPVKLFVSSIKEGRRFINAQQEKRAGERFLEWQRGDGPVMALAGVADSMGFELPDGWEGDE